MNCIAHSTRAAVCSKCSTKLHSFANRNGSALNRNPCAKKNMCDKRVLRFDQVSACKIMCRCRNKLVHRTHTYTHTHRHGQFIFGFFPFWTVNSEGNNCLWFYFRTATDANGNVSIPKTWTNAINSLSWWTLIWISDSEIVVCECNRSFEGNLPQSLRYYHSSVNRLLNESCLLPNTSLLTIPFWSMLKTW